MNILVIKFRGIIGPKIMQSYEESFKSIGCKVFTLDAKNKITEKDIFNISDFAPDFAISYGFNGMLYEESYGYILRNLKIPLVTLNYDNPFFVVDNDTIKELNAYPEYYYNFIWDDYFLELFKSKGIKNCYKIMLAADVLKFKPLKNVELNNSIAFVGSISEDTSKYKTNNELVNVFIDKIIELKMRNFDIPVLDICSKLFKTKKFIQIGNLLKTNSDVFWKVVYFAIHQKGSAVLRKHILLNINEININLYGKGCVNKDNINFCDFVQYGEELSKVYQENIINLNISSLQLETSVNNRVFDVFASKGFVLSDYKNDMKGIFKGYYDKICYNNINDLVQKSNYYIEHSKERKEIIDIAYEDVLRAHTYEHRAKYIIDTFLKARE